MSWTAPKTDWATAYLVTAADMNLYLRDNLACVGDHMGFSTWAPALSITSGSTAPGLGDAAVQDGSWLRAGTTVSGLVHGSCLIRFSSNSAAGTGIYTITLPLNASSSDTARQNVVGFGAIYDASGADTHHVVCVQHSSAVFKMKYATTGSAETWVRGNAPHAWSSDDRISLHHCYEVR